jgi:hypothetical protein
MRLLATTILFLALSGIAVPQRGNPDVQADMVAARQHLSAARDLALKAGNAWGGHRVTALKHMDAAMAEIDRAEAYAKAHHFIR